MAAVLGVPAPASAILPVVLGSESSAVEASQRLLEGGVLVPAIRYPTVPKGGARLRITLSANHTREEIEKLGKIDFMPRAGMVEDAP